MTDIGQTRYEEAVETTRSPQGSMPTVGRIVHYYPGYRNPDAIGQPIAAVITAVHGVACALFTMPFAEQPRSLSAVPFASDPTPGCWSWPPRT